MFMIHRIKSQGIAISLLLILIAGMLGSAECLNGLIDPVARAIPAIFSQETGGVNLGLFVLQRLMFLCLGISLFIYSILYVGRLTGKSENKKLLRVVGTSLLVISFIFGGVYESYFIEGAQKRETFRQFCMQSMHNSKVHVLEHDIYFKEKVKSLEATSRMRICNNSKRQIPTIVFYLNPTLTITRLSCEGKEEEYMRNEQVIEIKRTMQPGDTLDVKIEYKGKIDERVCYLDLSDKEFYDTRANSIGIFRFGNRQAYVGEEVTLLPPECLWYPRSESPVNVSSLYDRKIDFTHYSLTVEHANGRTAVSQGTAERLDEKTIFRHDHALQGISLSIAEYSSRSIDVDGTKYELFYFKDSEPLIRGYEAPEKVFKAIIRDMKFMTESMVCQMDTEYKSKNLELRRKQGEVDGENFDTYSPSGRYPYKWFIVMETPVSYVRYIRKWAIGEEYLQAGIVYLKERMANLPYLSSRKSHIEEWDMLATNNLKGRYEMIFKSGAYNVAPMFSGNTFFMTSEEFPAIHEVIKAIGLPIDKMIMAMQAPERVRDVMSYLQNHSLMQALEDKNISPKLLGEVIEWKSKELQEYLKHDVSGAKFYDFYNRFLQNHLFETIELDQFCEAYMSEFGQDIKKRLKDWYTRDRLPVLLLQDITLMKLPETEDNGVRGTPKAMAKFKVYNPGNIDGLVIVDGGIIKGEKVRSFLIRGHECKEISLKMNYMSYTITFPLAQNTPAGRLVQQNEARPFDGDTLTGVFSADSSLFLPRPCEIIVDNHDPGFKLIEPQGEKLFTMLRGGTKSWEQTGNNVDRWASMIDNSFYGKVLHDAYCKAVGTGKYKAEWIAEIPEDGTYEIYFYNTEFFKMGCVLQARIKGGVIYYTVYDREEGTTIQVEPAEEAIGWVSLGRYDFKKGKSRVVLDDRGTISEEKDKEETANGIKIMIMSNKQAIVADAVKWVKR